jgi:hypothetical protein
LSFPPNKIESTQGVLLQIDFEIGFDAPHHVEKVQDHLLLAPVGIPCRDGFSHPIVKFFSIL